MFVSDWLLSAISADGLSNDVDNAKPACCRKLRRFMNAPCFLNFRYLHYRSERVLQCDLNDPWIGRGCYLAECRTVQRIDRIIEVRMIEGVEKVAAQL